MDVSTKTWSEEVELGQSQWEILRQRKWSVQFITVVLWSPGYRRHTINIYAIDGCWLFSSWRFLSSHKQSHSLAIDDPLGHGSHHLLFLLMFLHRENKDESARLEVKGTQKNDQKSRCIRKNQASPGRGVGLLGHVERDYGLLFLLGGCAASLLEHHAVGCSIPCRIQQPKKES